ncbi:hypothetical protein F7P69_05620 [Cellulosimicrobium funkei]|nr:hypothetical protein [Cellulosimicrobium funkei]
MLLRTVLTTPAYLGMLVLVGGAAALLFYIAWRCLNGDTRTWALLPPFPFQVSKHNTWPFMLLMIGLTLLTALPTVFFEAARMEAAIDATWNVVLIPLALVALSFLWWPLAWTPRWFRNWAAQNNPGASPWTLEEIERVKAAPPSKRRNRAIKDIARVAGEEHVQGMVPEGILDKVHNNAMNHAEKHGITPDMDSFERAKIIRANRARWKEEKRQQKQVRRNRRS